MLQYKDVFALAEKKGYDVTAFNDAKIEYCHLCLLQKWLRDTHKIMIQVKFMKKQGEKYKSFIISIDTFNYIGERCEWVDTYENALLNGINAVLQLI